MPNSISMFKRKATAAALVLGMLGFALPAQATLVLDVGPGGDTNDCGGCGNVSGITFGWAFDVTSTILVGGIAAWDSDEQAFGPDVEAGLWTDAGALLVSTTISAGSPTEDSNGDGIWRGENIGPLTLTPGRYVVGVTFFNETPLAQVNTLFTTIPEVTYVEARSGSFAPNSGLEFPQFSAGTDGLFGPTLLAVVQPLPEPATLALFGFGLVGLGLAARRRRTG